jgi:superfamily I DNA/RNA helicase
MTTISWSAQQQDIFDWFKTGEGNLVVVARAGTGKTTTVLEATKYASERRILFCAFNKKNAVELGEKLANPNAEAKTLHALGFGFLRAYDSKLRVDNYRGLNIAKRVCQGAPEDIVKLVAQLASKAKGIRPHATQAGELTEIAMQFDLIPDEEWADKGYGVDYIEAMALAAMDAACDRDGTIDFDDMIYLPVRSKLIKACYDMVIVDECQDMNAMQIELARKACRKTGRIVVIGDNRQAIYAFRGADSESISRLQAELSATGLKLTTTYRCPKKIVALAATIVPDYEAAPSAPEGIIRTASRAKMLDEAAPGDFILSRKNAPLASICLALLKRGKRAKIEGRDIGAGLRNLVTKLAVGAAKNSLPALLVNLVSWEKREVIRAKASAKRPELCDARIEYIQDQAELLHDLAEDLTGVPELMTRLTDLFADGPNGSPHIVCSSVHRAKGMEAPRVYVLKDTLMLDRDDIEEHNIGYVAYTRAQEELVFSTSKDEE